MIVGIVLRKQSRTVAPELNGATVKGVTIDTIKKWFDKDKVILVMINNDIQIMVSYIKVVEGQNRKSCSSII